LVPSEGTHGLTTTVAFSPTATTLVGDAARPHRVPVALALRATHDTPAFVLRRMTDWLPEVLERAASEEAGPPRGRVARAKSFTGGVVRIGRNHAGRTSVAVRISVGP
jgi:hypothetical protein